MPPTPSLAYNKSSLGDAQNRDLYIRDLCQSALGIVEQDYISIDGQGAQTLVGMMRVGLSNNEGAFTFHTKSQGTQLSSSDTPPLTISSSHVTLNASSTVVASRLQLGDSVMMNIGSKIGTSGSSLEWLPSGISLGVPGNTLMRVTSSSGLDVAALPVFAQALHTLEIRSGSGLSIHTPSVVLASGSVVRIGNKNVLSSTALSVPLVDQLQTIGTASGMLTVSGSLSCLELQTPALTNLNHITTGPTGVLTISGSLTCDGRFGISDTNLEADASGLVIFVLGAKRLSLSPEGELDLYGSLKTQGVEILTSSGLGGGIKTCSLEHTTHSSFRVGSGVCSYVPLMTQSSMKILQGRHTPNSASGSVVFELSPFITNPRVFCQSEGTALSAVYSIQVLSTSTLGFSFSHQYFTGASGVVLTTESFSWLAVGE